MLPGGFVLRMIILKIFCGLIMVPVALASQVELLRCVEELKNIRGKDTTLLEFQAGIAIGSNATHLLLANERGVYAFALHRGRLNVLQVEIPNPDPRRKPRLLFLSYSQSEVYGSRVLTIDWDLPPQGRAPSQFHFKQPVNLMGALAERQFQQLIVEELKRIAELYRQGLLARADLLAGNLSLCRTLGVQDQKLAQWLNHQIGELEFVSAERRDSTRSPASVWP